MSMNISRRSFMKGAAAASLAVAASTMLTGCDMPDLGGIFGNLGVKKGSFTIGDKTVDITLKNCQYVSYYKQIIPTFEVKNNSDSAVTFVKKEGSSGYEIVPVFTYEGEDLTLVTKVPGTGSVAAGKTETLDLIGEASLNQWTGAKLTLTLYLNGNKVEGDPIVFNLTK